MGIEQQTELTEGHLLHRCVSAFVDQLTRSGVSHVCLCPGSRSTPLALLLRNHPSIKLWTHLDERSAAFFALGIAKALRQPVAVVSTSGTAAVNFAPAVVEAYYSHTPLLVLTADRPPELRHVGALQTIDQVRLYGTHVKWFVEMPLPDASETMVRYAHTIASRVVTTACADGAGPVHVNFPFREPLIPRERQSLAENRPNRSVAIVRSPRQPDPADLADLAAELRTVERGFIVCGPQEDRQFPAVVTQLAEELDFPLLADSLSQVRCGVHHDQCVIDSYDAFLRVEEIAHHLAPDLILRFGATPVSKPLLLHMQRYAAPRHIFIEEGDGWHDSTLVTNEAHYAHPRLFCESLLIALQTTPRRPKSRLWKDRWIEVGTQTRATLQASLQRNVDFSEPRVFAELTDLLPPGTTLFAGNSMPVRDLDTFFPGGKNIVHFLANRGASGIDGVVSTALGVSAASSSPVVLIIGDLSFYHDLNGLLAAKRHQLQATILLLHNDGGGIFSFLPQADNPEHFEELFGTPHGLDFRPAAEMYGLTYERPAGWEEFRTAVQRSLDAPGVTLIEVRTERRANVDLHRNLWKTVARSVGKSGANEGSA